MQHRVNIDWVGLAFWGAAGYALYKLVVQPAMLSGPTLGTCNTCTPRGW